ncbi:hypothetical protein [Clostridioides difficile]|uniref:hypothetical protein n=1 Tax=Clostridioides difficile TaxID=1496 RepID=UPI0030D00F53
MNSLSPAVFASIASVAAFNVTFDASKFSVLLLLVLLFCYFSSALSLLLACDDD